jgi:hypothetical protein
MRGTIPPLPQYVFMAWCLVKHRDNVPLPLPLYYTKLKFKYKISHRTKNGIRHKM